MIWRRPLRRWRATLAAALALAPGLMASAWAQEAGWHYSPLPGEGDRAAMGCAHGSTPALYSCIVVRCEDDFSVGAHIHTSRHGGDTGRWRIEFDKGDPAFDVDAIADTSPYGARIVGDVEPVLVGLKTLGLVYLAPLDGAEIDQQIGLGGSLKAITEALYYCAPRVPPALEPEPAS